MPNSKNQSDSVSQLADVLDALRHAGLVEDLVSVVLFGSRSREKARPESDWDLLELAVAFRKGPCRGISF